MFAYLSKKIAIPHKIKLHSVSWNTDQGWIACGGEKGLLKVLKLDSKASGGSNLSMNQTLDGHKGAVCVITWNSVQEKLTTSDEEGLIIVWMLSDGKWFEEMINNRNKSVVRDMKWTANGQKICIVYEDGAVIVGSVDGNRLWGKDLDLQLSNVEWSPDARHILFATTDSEVYLYDSQGNRISKVSLIAGQTAGHSPLVGMDWYPGRKLQGKNSLQIPSLAVGFRNGKIQIMKEVGDMSPVLIDTGMETTTSMKWDTNGIVLAISGSKEFKGSNGEQKKQQMIQFYSPFGKHLRTLKIPGSSIAAITWERDSLRLAIAMESYIYFANIRPDYKWGYFNNTLVYSFKKPDRTEHCVSFWDPKTKERHIKYVRKLVTIDAGGQHCVFCTKTDDSFDQYILILCNAIGSPADSKYITVQPLFTAMTSQHVIIASESMVYVWQYRTATSRLTSINGASNKSGSDRELLWFIDQAPSIKASKQYLDQNEYDSSNAKYPVTNDPICCLCASTDTLMVGRQSGIVMRFSLPHVQMIDRYNVKCRPNYIHLNCNSTKLSVIEINGFLTIFDINQEGDDTAVALPVHRKDCWNFMWSSDNPDLFACMEKSRMYVFRKNHPEEPVASSSYLCEFKDLCITAVQLDDIMNEPETYLLDYPDDCVINFETKSLRDTTELLASTPMSEAYSFIEDNPHPRLWKLLAECALEKLNFSVADKAFVRCRDYQGIQFVKRLKMMTNKKQQKAEVEAYFHRFAEAERLYVEMDKKELAIALRMRLGDWFRVVQLVNHGSVNEMTKAWDNDAMITKAWNNIGDYYADRQKWDKAKRYFMRAKNFEKVAECAYVVDDYKTLKELLSVVPEGTPWLKKLGEKFQGVGLCTEAVTAYTRLGDPKAAIDCCVLLNQWDLGVKLAEEHKFVQIQGLLSKYATHLLQKNQIFEAIELYQKAGKFTESARLLAGLGKQALKNKVHYLRAKQLYVLAALDVEKYKERKFNSKNTVGKDSRQTAAMTLQSLMEADRDIGSDSNLEDPWHGALGLHLYLLAQRQLYTGQHSNAMHTALQLVRYEDVLDPKDIYSLIALASFSNRFFGQCSRAFIRLESLDSFTEEDREKYKDLAMSIFVKNPPKDPPTRDTACPICASPCNPWDQQCPHCNASIPVCIVSGRAIFTQNHFTCGRCHFNIYERLVRRFVNCPLCHANLQDGVRKQSSSGRSSTSRMKMAP
mmetsp:Transcript_14038/g.22384  ORF Transcript_14038/g.22384 Transcript_14038/m.22384 type:complete len:1210 (-) Transcript_14038:255-3884(-)